MFQIGQIFNKNGIEMCVVDIIEYNMKKYLLMSQENECIDYVFYEMQKSELGYKLIKINDDELNYNLFNICGGIKDE